MQCIELGACSCLAQVWHLDSTEQIEAWELQTTLVGEAPLNLASACITESSKIGRSMPKAYHWTMTYAQQVKWQGGTSDAVGADSLGRPVSLASFLVEPLATPFSAFWASATAAVSLLVSRRSGRAKLFELSLKACFTDCMAVKPLVCVMLAAGVLLRVWNPFLSAASVILVASAGELPFKALPDVVLS